MWRLVPKEKKPRELIHCGLIATFLNFLLTQSTPDVDDVLKEQIYVN